jgi:hypothetical protein
VVQAKGVINTSGDVVQVETGTMISFFAVVMRNMCNMVDAVMTDISTRQLQMPSKILLVGGLGSSAYVRQQLETMVRFRKWNIEIITPSIGLVAVVQGELQFGSRISACLVLHTHGVQRWVVAPCGCDRLTHTAFWSIFWNVQTCSSAHQQPLSVHPAGATCGNCTCGSLYH